MLADTAPLLYLSSLEFAKLFLLNPLTHTQVEDCHRPFSIIRRCPDPITENIMALLKRNHQTDSLRLE